MLLFLKFRESSDSTESFDRVDVDSDFKTTIKCIRQYLILWADPQNLYRCRR